jgi:hypothetical protein
MKLDVMDSQSMDWTGSLMYGSASDDGLDGIDNGRLGGRAMYGSASYDGWDGSAMGPLGVARWIGRARQWTLRREMYGLALHDGKFHE